MTSSRREMLNEPAPQRRNPRRFVGESYRDCVDRLAGELTAAEKDRDALKARVEELEARVRNLQVENVELSCQLDSAEEAVAAALAQGEKL